MTMYPAFLRDAENESPYDMVYSEIYGMNRATVTGGQEYFGAAWRYGRACDTDAVS